MINKPMSAGPESLAWQRLVVGEHEQADRVRGDAAMSEDFWKPFAHRFAPEKGVDGSADPGLEDILRLVRPGDSILDVGAGGGRIAIPVAQQCRQVTAVDPSQSMLERLNEHAGKWGVRNIQTVASTWEAAEVGPADVVICAHVMYTVRDPVAFVRKLEAHARRTVAIVMFDEPAVSQYFPLWPLVHGEERMRLPCLAELERLLVEMRVVHHKEELPPREPRGFENIEQAVSESMGRLFVAPDSPRAAKVEKAVKASLAPYGDGVRFVWARAQRPSLITWKPSAR